MKNNISSPASVAGVTSPVPVTPTKKAKPIVVDSSDRRRARKGEKLNTIDAATRESFRDQIIKLYKEEFGVFCTADSLTFEFLLNAFESYIDFEADRLTDEKFDPADLSAALLAANEGLPLLVDNLGMKKQINLGLLRHVVAKDAQIVDFKEYSKLTKHSIYAYNNKLDENQVAGMNIDFKIGVADTGFISGLAKKGVVDPSLQDAFIVPEFAFKECRTETAKPIMPYRAPKSYKVQRLIAERESVIAFVNGVVLAKDALQLQAQPMPSEVGVVPFPLLKEEIKKGLSGFCSHTVSSMNNMLERCFAYRVVMTKYQFHTSEVDYIYGVYSAIYGDKTVARDQFSYEEFLQSITSYQGLQKAIDTIVKDGRKIRSAKVSALAKHIKQAEAEKSADNYARNSVIKEMAMKWNESFGPLYNIHRSLVNGKITKDISQEMCLKFHLHLLSLLDSKTFVKYSNDGKIKREINSSLKLFMGKLFAIFQRVDCDLDVIRLNPLSQQDKDAIAKDLFGNPASAAGASSSFASGAASQPLVVVNTSTAVSSNSLSAAKPQPVLPIASGKENNPVLVRSRTV